MSVLFAVEADNFVLCHAIFILRNSGNGLNEAHHCLITLRVKFPIVTCFDTFKLISTIFDGINRCFFLDGVLEIGQEPQAIVNLNFE